MEMRQLRYFLAVAERLHFTRAAEALNVAQPALSQQIALLEQEIGVRLLERTNRRVQLTPAGQAFRNKAIMALQCAEEAAEEAKKVGRGEAGILTIGFVGSAALFVLPALLDQLKTRVPAATFELFEMNPEAQMTALQHNKIDLGVTSFFLNYGGLEAKLLSREPLIVALPEGHPLIRHRQVDLKSLAEENILLPPRYGLGGLHDQIVTACHQAGFIPRHEMSIKLAQIAISLVAGNVGIALIPKSVSRLSMKGVIYKSLRQRVPFELFACRRAKQNTRLMDIVWNQIVPLDTEQGRPVRIKK
jgi:DNA-binding transcriptional LysR family regulator